MKLREVAGVGKGAGNAELAGGSAQEVPHAL